MLYFQVGGAKSTMKKNRLFRLIWKDTRGQDLIEYALMAGFVAVAAGAIMPGVATGISRIFDKISHAMCVSAANREGTEVAKCAVIVPASGK